MDNVRVDRAARFHSTFAAPDLMRNTLPPLRSNELLGVAIVLIGFGFINDPRYTNCEFELGYRQTHKRFWNKCRF